MDKTEKVKSLKGTVNGWGKFSTAFDGGSPSQGQFEKNLISGKHKPIVSQEIFDRCIQMWVRASNTYGIINLTISVSSKS